MNDDRHQGTTTTATAVSRSQHQILTLLDRQGRNILHHMLDTVIPADDSSDAIRLAVFIVPLLLYQRDVRGCTPLEYVLSRLVDNSSNPRWKKHLPNDYGNDTRGIGKQRNYTMLKLLVECMHYDTVNSIDDDSSEGGRMQQLGSSRNVLQLACLLPRNTCPHDGSLIPYLCSTKSSALEVKAISSRTLSTRRWEQNDTDGGIPTINMAGEVDDDGNYAMHLFLLNKSYSHLTNELLYIPECNILRALIDVHRDAISTQNVNGEYPLRIAMRAGRRRAVSVLLTEYPDAVLHNDDDSLINVHNYVHILGCISIPTNLIGDGDNCNPYDDVECRCITIMFNLLRARPDIFSVANSNTRSCSDIILGSTDESKEEEKKDGRSKGGLTLTERRRKKKLPWWSKIHLLA